MEETTEKRDWLNVTEAMKYIGVSRQTIYNLMDDGVLPYHELKGVRGRRIKKRDLDALVVKSQPKSKDK